MMKMISWNVNGLRAAMGKGFMDFFRQQDADIFCLQETKLQEGQIQLDMPGYYQYWNYAEKKGYSGTAVFTKRKPVNVMLGIGMEEHDREGRVITLEFDEFYFITVYTPNSQNELARLPYRMEWRKDTESRGQRLYRYFQIFQPPDRRDIFLVVLQIQGQRKKRGMAYRLFYGVRELKRQAEGR